MDALYRLEAAGVAEVVREMPGEPSSDSVRVTLGILERKGWVNHRRDGNRNVYAPIVPRARARKQAARHLTRTFFDGKPSRAILALLDMSSDQLTQAELDEITARIERAGKKGPR